jgi:arylsulfatase A-like enzyme
MARSTAGGARPGGRRGIVATSAAFVALLIGACGRPSGPSETTAALDRLAGLGPRTFVRVSDETRPAVVLRSGERRSCRALLAPGSRLRFSLALLEGAPRDGYVQLRITASGRSVFHHRFPIEGHDGFWHRSVPVAGEGAATLEFAVDLLPRSAASEKKACIALASPRLRLRSPARPRTFLWISQDTVRADHLGAYGYGRATSPGFDERSADWVVFESAVATASWTLPSMASQMLSRYPSYHGAVMETLAANEAPTLFEQLAADGFTVIGVTGNPYISYERSLAQGFDALWQTDGRADEVDRLLLAAPDLPVEGDVALFVHYMDPHVSYSPPPPYNRMFDDPDYRGRVDGGTNFFKRHRVIGRADTEHLKALYDGEIAFTDVNVSRLLEALRARGLLDDPVIAYTADHGEEFRDHGYWGHSRTLYEELLHVPFALRLPGLPGRRVSQVVSLVDLAPTVLAALGVSSPPTFQGRSLLPLARGGTLAALPAFAETILTPDRRQLVSARLGSLKYIVAVPRGRDQAAVPLHEEAYDLDADPGEQHSRMTLASLSSLRRSTLAYLTRAREEGRPGPAALVDPEAIRKLRAWGYVQ